MTLSNYNIDLTCPSCNGLIIILRDYFRIKFDSYI